MMYIYNEIWFSYETEWNLALCNNMDGPRGYCAEWNKSDIERQMPEDFTYMWNLKIKINKQAEQKQNHRYGEYFHGCQMGGHEKGEGIYNYKMVVTE